jgi:hypothetical protein
MLGGARGGHGGGLRWRCDDLRGRGSRQPQDTDGEREMGNGARKKISHLGGVIWRCGVRKNNFLYCWIAARDKAQQRLSHTST